MKKQIAYLLSATLLAACGGGGGSSGGGGTAAVMNTPGTTTAGAPAAVGKPKSVFVYDLAHQSLDGYAAPLDTADTPAHFASPGALTPGEKLAYDAARDVLYRAQGDSVAVHEHASAPASGATAARTWKVDAGNVRSVEMLHYDKVHDVLYASASAYDQSYILAFARPSTLSGSVKPARAFRYPMLAGFTVDARRNILYATWHFTNPSAESRIWTVSGLDTYNEPAAFDPSSPPDASGKMVASVFAVDGGTLGNLAVDPEHDRLYYTSKGKVQYVDQASSHAVPRTDPSKWPYATSTALALPGATSWDAALAYDAAGDRLYVGSDDILHEVNKASAAAAGGDVRSVRLPAGAKIMGLTAP